MSQHEARFRLQLRAVKLPPHRHEYRFHPTRRWRFDFCWPDHMVAVEIDGSVWTQGRHTRGSGYVKDCEKLNAAAELGWRVFRYPPESVKSGEAIAQIERVLTQEAA